MKKFALVLLTLLGICIVGLAIWSRPPPPIPLPSPNGYDDLVKAGNTLTENFYDYRTASIEELRTFITTNATALQLARVGLNRKCRVPADFGLTNSARDLPGLRRLVYVFAAEGRLAELENRQTDGARSYLDGIRLGNEISRGGYIIHRLVGIACEVTTERDLASLVAKLNCEQSRYVISELERLDSVGVTWEEVWQQEKLFMRRQFRQYRNPLRLIGDLQQARATRRSAE